MTETMIADAALISPQMIAVSNVVVLSHKKGPPKESRVVGYLITQRKIHHTNVQRAHYCQKKYTLVAPYAVCSMVNCGT